IHHLSLDAEGAVGRALAQPAEGVDVVLVEAELGPPARVVDRLARRPRVLATRVEARPREVEPVGAAVRAEHLRFDPREQSKGLGIALEAADARGPGAQGALPIVTEGRMSEVVS